MASDYEAICEENRAEYTPKSINLLGFVSDKLYSDRTHFVFELLQNAEDAGASGVQFHLFADRLEFTHDGRAFTTADIVSICDAVASTKEDDPGQIGRFGIGFKSVYAVTSSPEIHSGDEHFAIADYVFPHAISRRSPMRERETLFVFPFNRANVDREAVHREIRRDFEGFDTVSILFLRNITKVEFSVEDESVGAHSRKEKIEGAARRICLTESAADESRVETFLAFERPAASSERGVRPVEIAFSIGLSAPGEGEEIKPLASTDLFAFFPTQKKSGLGFFVQGPFETTPARDNIYQDNEWNSVLFGEVAELVVEALRELKALGLLAVAAFSTLPLHEADWPVDSDHRPIFERVLAALKSEALLPTSWNGHAHATEVALASTNGLQTLLSARDLGRLLGEQNMVWWLAPEFGVGTYSASVKPYLIRLLGIEEITPEKVISHLGEQFLCDCSDEWIAKLYVFLNGQRAQFDTLKRRPILRLEDGSHVAPFDPNDIPQGYLPDEKLTTTLPTVRRAIVDADEKAVEFLEALKIRKVDLVDEVVKHVLPRYREALEPDKDAEHHARDLDIIRQALASADEKRRDDLEKSLREARFLRCKKFGTETLGYLRPADNPYLSTPELASYFDESNNAWYFDDESADDLRKTLGIGGVDLCTVVQKHVLPRYHSTLDAAEDAEHHARDVQLIRQAFDSATEWRRKELMDQLRWRRFLRCKGFGKGEIEYRRPGDKVYFCTPELECYFENSRNAWYVEDDIDNDLLEALDVSWELRIVARPAESRGYVIAQEDRGGHRRGLKGFDPDFSVDGLADALKEPSHERSSFVWNFVLVPNSRNLEGEVERDSRKNYPNPKRESKRSGPTQIAREHAWIPKADGSFARPSEIAFEDLPKDFEPDRTVAEALGMQMPELVEFSSSIGVPPEILQDFKEHPELAAEFMEFKAQKHRAAFGVVGQDEGGNGDDVLNGHARVAPGDARGYVAQIFARPGAPRTTGVNKFDRSDAVVGAVANPEFRRERVRDEINEQVEAGQAAGPAFRRVPRKVWDRKDSAVREALLNFYRGCCQICEYGFLKEDGEPYFEALSLIPFSEATWADRAGNVLCLCPNCSAKFQYGPVEADDILGQVDRWRAAAEGGSTPPVLRIRLGDDVSIRFTERHFLDLQELLRELDVDEQPDLI